MKLTLTPLFVYTCEGFFAQLISWLRDKKHNKFHATLERWVGEQLQIVLLLELVENRSFHLTYALVSKST